MAERKSRVQSEIEKFLAEVTGSPAAQAQNEDAERQKGRRDREAAAKRRQRKAAAERRRKAEAAAALAKSKQKNQRRSVDSSISQHVTEYLDNDIEEYVEATIVDSVNSHLGKREDEMPITDARGRPTNTSNPAAEVARLLRDPKGVRNAILINEILSRPRALRRD